MIIHMFPFRKKKNLGFSPLYRQYSQGININGEMDIYSYKHISFYKFT